MNYGVSMRSFAVGIHAYVHIDKMGGMTYLRRGSSSSSSSSSISVKEGKCSIWRSYYYCCHWWIGESSHNVEEGKWRKAFGMMQEVRTKT